MDSFLHACSASFSDVHELVGVFCVPHSELGVVSHYVFITFDVNLDPYVFQSTAGDFPECPSQKQSNTFNKKWFEVSTIIILKF